MQAFGKGAGCRILEGVARVSRDHLGAGEHVAGDGEAGAARTRPHQGTHCVAVYTAAIGSGRRRWTWSWRVRAALVGRGEDVCTTVRRGCARAQHARGRCGP